MVAHPRPARRRQGAELLASDYWKPVYCYVRARWASTNEDAKDLTQDFFVWMLESGFVRRADPKRGRFRSFLKVALDHYAGMERRKQGREKRGGTRRKLTLDIQSSPPAAAAGATPEQALDDAWKAELLARAAHTLEESCKREGKPLYYAVFRDYFLHGDADYAQLAARYEISAVDVSNYLTRAKERFRDALRGLVAETVGGLEELDTEMKALFGEKLA